MSCSEVSTVSHMTYKGPSPSEQGKSWRTKSSGNKQVLALPRGVSFPSLEVSFPSLEVCKHKLPLGTWQQVETAAHTWGRVNLGLDLRTQVNNLVLLRKNWRCQGLRIPEGSVFCSLPLPWRCLHRMRRPGARGGGGRKGPGNQREIWQAQT